MICPTIAAGYESVSLFRFFFCFLWEYLGQPATSYKVLLDLNMDVHISLE